uniref:C1 repressor inactivator n=1 Tax=feces metagenome TaxID=1861841 RepID=A0A7M2QMB2_9ZZZZ
MAFITPTRDDVRNYSNDLSLDLTSADAARTIMKHHLTLSNQEYRVSDDELIDLEDCIEYLIDSLLTESS